MDAYRAAGHHLNESTEQVKVEFEDFSVHVPTIGLNLDPQQLDQYDAEKVYANECPFCSGDDHDNATDEEHEAAMNYHTQAAKAAPTLAEKHHQSRQYMRHQAKRKDL
jgi:hypothetical protein